MDTVRKPIRNATVSPEVDTVASYSVGDSALHGATGTVTVDPVARSWMPSAGTDTVAGTDASTRSVP